MTIPKSELAAIRERCEKATEGPWTHKDAKVHAVNPRLADERTIVDAICDARFSAHARTDIPDLLDEVERLEAWRQESETRRRELMRSCEIFEAAHLKAIERQTAAEERLELVSGYTTHGVSCHIRGSGPGECTCGLDKALEEK